MLPACVLGEKAWILSFLNLGVHMGRRIERLMMNELRLNDVAWPSTGMKSHYRKPVHGRIETQPQDENA